MRIDRVELTQAISRIDRTCGRVAEIFVQVVAVVVRRQAISITFSTSVVAVERRDPVSALAQQSRAALWQVVRRPSSCTIDRLHSRADVRALVT